ncbi:MAG: ABC transporter substrate-binding protein [Deltaproteobacteria bacterium]|nr:ABC transporter substrate-binding protein [Deltaproteobacteria bacterium]
MRHCSRLFVTAALLLFSLQALAAQPDPRTIIDENTKKIHELVLASKNDDEMRLKVKGQLEGFVDFEEFGKLCLGKEWDKLTADQRSRYLAEFRALLERTYLKRFKAGKPFASTFRGETRMNKTGDRAEVRTTITAEDVGADVDYRFYSKNGWKVYDILVDEVSMMRNFRKSFLKVMRKDGFDALLHKMQNRNEELEKAGDGGEGGAGEEDE